MKDWSIFRYHGEPGLVPRRPCRRLSQAVFEQAAVGQAGQEVVMRHVLHFFHHLIRFGDVGQQTNVVGHIGPGFHGADIGADEIFFAGFLPVPDLALPVADGMQGLPHFSVEAVGVAFRGKHFRVLANDFIRTITGQAFQSLVHGQGTIVGSGNDDAFRGALEDTGGQFQLIFRLLVARDVLEYSDGADGPVAIEQRFCLKGQVTPLAVEVAEPALGLVAVAGKFRCFVPTVVT